MSALSRLKASPGLLVRALVALGAVAAIAAGLAAFASRQVLLGADVAGEIVVLVVVGALTRRYGIALPGNGFSSFILGVAAYAILDRGWTFGVVVAPLAMVTGDLALRRLPVTAALDNAAHLTTGAALAGLAYARLGGATGTAPSISSWRSGVPWPGSTRPSPRGGRPWCTPARWVWPSPPSRSRTRAWTWSGSW